ncbi:MAG: endonuclease III [Epsilonproteobacteria bacterium]|nr:endonuclease III [Campylobacterota bacterium]|tara:strand:- start:9164 stop:9985 length:822 start_codon:yes stop_codon:yes gene_type:complete
MAQQIQEFQKKIYNYYNTHKRNFDWRSDITSYKIVVSEVMLQQTQTKRVIQKFRQWLQTFPDFESLAQATTQEVLRCWQGLGYNRRGLALQEFAQRIVQEFDGVVPDNPEVLQTFKSIGPNTAGSICAFAFNKPVVFIETNIRTVFIHEFFKEQTNIDDKQLLPLIEQAVDRDNPREWYYALMDYGVYLKTVVKVSNAASKHYTKQSKFVGSARQMRGVIVKILSRVNQISREELCELVSVELPNNTHDVEQVVTSLAADGFLKAKNEYIQLV